MPRALIVSHYFSPHVGGIETVVGEHCRILRDEGWEIELFTTRIPRSTCRYQGGRVTVNRYVAVNVLETQLGVPVPFPSPRLLWDLRRSAKRADVVIAHGHAYPTSMFAALAAHLAGCPFVLVQHNPFVNFGPLLNVVERCIDASLGRLTLQSADLITCVSKYTEAYVHSIVPSCRAITIPNGVNVDRFFPGPSPPDVTKPRFVSLRRLVPRNGLDVLLDAWELARLSPAAELVVGGTGSEEAALRARAEGLPGVRIIGRVPDDDHADFYRGALAAVMPTISGEGFGLMAVEAMACGTPVIASDQGALSEVVRDGETGILVPPGDARALADAMRRLFASSENARPPRCARAPRHDQLARVGGALRARTTRSSRSGSCMSVEAEHAPYPPGVNSDPGATSRAALDSEQRRSTRSAQRRGSLAETVASVVVATIGALLLFKLVRSEPGYWLPPDAAHALAEADYLRGNDVIGYSHPPAFPALVVAWNVVLNRYDAVLAAMCTAVGLSALAVYALARQWFDIRAAATGALVATTLPIMAEAVSWGGGSSTLGNAAAIGALAATQLWCSQAGRNRSASRGWLVGALIGVAGAAHPFSLAVALFLCGGRLIVELWHRRCVRLWSLGPNGVAGWLSLAVGAVPFLVLSHTYYTTVQQPGQSSIGIPDLSPFTALVSWSSRENLVLLLLAVGSLLLPLYVRSWSLRASAVLLDSVVIGVPVLVKGDSSYQSRAMYFIPALVALAVAFAFEPAVEWTRRIVGGSAEIVGRILLVTAVGLTIIFGFSERMAVAVPSYERIQSGDVPLLESLRSARGLVAASYFSNEYAAPTSWLINGVSRRPAWSPTGPWYSTTATEINAGQDMQRLFSGQVGVENSKLQLSAWGAGPDFGFTISTKVNGYFLPLVTLDASRTEFPFEVRNSRASLIDHGVALALEGPADAPRTVVVAARLSSDGAELEFVDLSLTKSDDWHVVFSPPDGFPWTPLRRSAAVVDLEQKVLGEVSEMRLAATKPTSDSSLIVRTFGPGLPVDVDVHRSSSLAVAFSMGQGDLGPVTHRFTEKQILTRYDVSALALWLNSGTRQRFASSCYRDGSAGPSVAVVQVALRCRQ